MGMQSYLRVGEMGIDEMEIGKSGSMRNGMIQRFVASNSTEHLWSRVKFVPQSTDLQSLARDTP